MCASRPLFLQIRLQNKNNAQTIFLMFGGWFDRLGCVKRVGEGGLRTP
jgi:hypothetical protein